MVEVDQYARGLLDVVHQQRFSSEEVTCFWKEFSPRLRGIDEENSEAMKSLLTVRKWFTISEFGAIADNNAWLVVQHADHDLGFQKDVLKRLASLYPKGETSRRNYAYLSDRVAIAERRAQLFGTQGRCTGPGVWEPSVIEDLAHVDLRREEMDLEPLAAYMGRFREICR